MATQVATNSQVDAIRRILAKSGLPSVPWYGVLDACQDAQSPQRARDAGLHSQSLYAGPLGARLDHVAPHLITFDLRGGISDWLFENWGGHHGILFQSPAGFDLLRKHFRHFLMVKDGEGRKYRLRFYDPRVLRAFLPVCTPAELKDFFGPIAAFYAADRYARNVLAFTLGPKGLIVKTHPIEPAGADNAAG